VERGIEKDVCQPEALYRRSITRKKQRGWVERSRRSPTEVNSQGRTKNGGKEGAGAL